MSNPQLVVVEDAVVNFHIITEFRQQFSPLSGHIITGHADRGWAVYSPFAQPSTKASENHTRLDAPHVSLQRNDHREAARQEAVSESSQQANSLEDQDYQIFLALDHKLDAEKLYCDPNMNRDMLCQLAGVEKNRLGRIITTFSGAANSTAYISAKCMRYAAQLLREHPDWTILHIATTCGIPNTSTFNRLFR